jgi:hypothetical protein
LQLCAFVFLDPEVLFQKVAEFTQVDGLGLGGGSALFFLFGHGSALLLGGFVGDLHRIGLAEGLRNPHTALDYLNDVLEPTLQALETRLAGLVAQRAIVECDTRHAALLLLSPLLLALLHQRDLGGTRCRPLSIPALIDEHVKVFVRAYRRPG